MTGQDILGLDSNYSFLTIAGQTSPGGITFSGGHEPIWCYHGDLHDMTVRHLRFRNPNAEHAGIVLAGARNFVIDHCDFSGGMDECLDICSSKDFTVQWSTIANSSACGEWCQTYGFIMAYAPTCRITIHHNMMANHKFRGAAEIHWNYGPIEDSGKLDLRNNVVYNGSTKICYWYISPIMTMPTRALINLVGNYCKAGPNTETAANGCMSLGDSVWDYNSDNSWLGATGGVKTSGIGERKNSASEFPFPTVTTHTAQQAYDTVLAKAGAWPRDPMNVRTVNEIKTGTGEYGKQDDAKITSGPAAPADADMDGMPDCWETAYGLNPNDSTDSRGDKNGDGYTNIEEYINDVALTLEGKTPRNFSLSGGCPADVEVKKASFQGMGLIVRPSVVTAAAGRVEISLSNQAAHSGCLRISDVLGRIHAVFPAQREISWDLKDSRGRSLAAGVYIVQWLDAHGNSLEKRVTVAR
jgi:hypothetical protein